MQRMTRSRPLRLTRRIFLCCCLLSGALQAAQNLYDVEVIIFTTQGTGDDGELMGKPAPDAALPTGVFPEDQFTELSPDYYTLDPIRNTLSATPGYSVLFHRAWRQLGYDRAAAVDYPVHSLAANGRDSIEGTVTLIRERYLHLDMDLLLMTAAGSGAVLYSDEPGSVPAFRLSENRRVRSEELHYFDHPRFGVIARVTPYEAPEQAQEPVLPEPVGDEDAGAALPETETAAEPATADDQLTR